MKLRIFLIILMAGFLLPLLTNAQIKYGISLHGGASNITINDNDRKISLASEFRPSTHFSIESFITENVNKSRFSFEQGLSLETSEVEDWISDKIYQDFLEYGYNYPQYYSFRTYQLCIPLRVKYDFEKWLSFHAGLSNVLYLKKQATFVNNTYALRGELGADVSIAKRYIIGIKGSYDLTPSGQMWNLMPSGQIQDCNIFIHYYSLSVKVGVLLSSFKKR